MNPRLVILGTGGRLGAALLRQYRTDYSVTGFDRAQLDLASPDQLRDTLAALDFDILINCAAMTNVDGCEREPEKAFAINAAAPGVLGKLCAERKARLIHISTDYVFDGAKSDPYTEEDEANPISVYGESKRDGEHRVLAADASHLVVRVSWVFGPDRPSFVDWIIEQACRHEQVAAVADKISTPTYTLDLAEMLRPLLWSRPALGPDGELKTGATGPGAGRLPAEALDGGIVHLANRGACSWREYGQWALDCCQAEGITLRARTVDALTLADMQQFVARRPIYTVLSTEKYERLSGHTPRGWQEAVRDYVRAYIAPRAQV